jgi:signal transduction histidine kinase/CheY-like chemotaxis protein
MTETGRFAGFERLAPRLAIGMAVFLLVAGFAIVLLGAQYTRQQEVAGVEMQTRILASAVSAALAFDDRRAGKEYVSALEASPNVLVAAVYDANGKSFVAYTRGRGTAPPATAPAPGSEIVESRLGIAMPVTQSDTRLGTVYLEVLIEPARRRLMRSGLIALLILLTALVVAVLGISQRALAKVNAELERRASELALSNEKLQIQIEQREKAEAALRHSQKMEAIGQLTGGVAHDFNNLLQIILGSLQTLKRRSARWKMEAADSQDFHRFVEAGIGGGERAAALTHQLLAFSRRQPLAPKSVDLNKLVAGMSDLLRRTLGESIAIETVLSGRLWKVHTDPNQLENVILNLAVNARDAMPNGGRLSIETANVDLDEADVREQEDLLPGQYAVIRVTDNGVGMTKETLTKVFEPFFTTKDIGQGTGLGLSQAYGFVKQSGGHIRITSELGQGAVVTLYLPRHLGADDQDALKQPDLPPPGGTLNETILVVEDEDGVRVASVGMLRELGYRVLEAPDGQRALSILQSDPDICLLFTDVGLPGGLNGRQLADKARQLRPTLKVLFTTGYARDAIVHHGRLDPGVALITKPFAYRALAEKVREVLSGVEE